ncbi:ABC transporter permease [Shinella sumterensis]|uniref:ABC transporter permease n=1 Tax=Shinella sumterensis TaxID=1967501 RepID=UPI00106DE617|nr:ABC transporter permease [Shinella sumterensis]MCD1265400.1 ABC transporter permease [Shinella sumterensis]TFE93019.1 ABC transporter permease [Shinella sumterensis]
MSSDITRQAPPATDSSSLGKFLGDTMRRPEFGAFIGTLTVFVFFAVVTSGNGFLTWRGTAGWLNVAAELGIVAVPVALLMIGGELDLSVGSVIGATSVLVAVATGIYGAPIWLSIALALALGVGVGLFNGIVTVRTGLPSFIVTLVSMLALAGLALGLTRFLVGTPNVSLSVEGAWRFLFAGKWGPASISIIWWVLVSLVAGWVLFRTQFGNWIQATGGDRQSAREAGIRTDRVKITLFILTAVAAVLVGVIQTMTFNGGEATRGQVYVFNSIIATVIGGVLLQGGYGSPIGVMLGAMTFGIVNVGIFYTGWSSDWAQLLLGLLLLAAVLTNNLFRRLAMRA